MAIHASKFKNQYTSYEVKKSISNGITDYNNFDMSLCNADIIDYKNLTQLTLENLAKIHKDVNIYIANAKGVSNIRNIASSLGAGKHIVLSQEFIDKMGIDAESYNKCKQILDGTMKQLSEANFEVKSIGACVDENGITFWNTVEDKKGVNTTPESNDNIIDMMKKMQQEMDDLKNKFKIINTNSAFNAPMEVYSKLARAKNTAEVKVVASAARFKITRLKSMLRDCEDADKRKIKAAIRQLDKAITRAYRKVQDLSKEDNLNQEGLNAKRRNEKKLAEYKESELQKRIVVRKIRERAQISEANQLYYYPQMLLNKKSNYEEKPVSEFVPIEVQNYTSTQVADDVINIDAEIPIVNVSPTIQISI